MMTAMYSFPLKPEERFQGKSAAIKRPREIGYFSYDDQHEYHQDDRSLRYYYPPCMGADLCKGFDTFRQIDDSKDDHLEGLLKAIIHIEKTSGEKCEADLITWRGMMTKIMATPGDWMMGSGFEMNATLFQGTIYLEENHEYKLISRTKQHSQPARPGTHSQDMMSFWGYKFETLSLMPHIWAETSREYIENREDEIVDNFAQYCSIVRTGIGTSKLILGGEVDAVIGAKPENKNTPIDWVELKTSACITNDKDMLKYERKLQKFWIQSFLLGVPKIVVGFRTQQGILDHLEELETGKIPSLVKRKGKNSWDGNVSINFAAAFLEWLKLTITSEGLWRIRRAERGQAIEVEQLSNSGHGGILSEEFLQWRQRPFENDQRNLNEEDSEHIAQA